jgi:hypothetical protein
MAAAEKSYTTPTQSKIHRKRKGLHCYRPLILLVPLAGFELATYRLQGGCSTN